MTIDPTIPEGIAGGLDGIVERLDHVSVGVRDLDDAMPLVRLMGGEFLDGGDFADGGFRWIQFTLPGPAKLELIQPLPGAGEDNFLERFLASRGEGVHHVTLKVSDLHEAVAKARAMGFDVVGVDDSHANWKEAFIHPKGASGVVIQLAEWDDLPPPTDRTVEDVLRGVPDRYV